ncbi:MAG: ABC transporter ATP-binding protein [Methanomicrobiales archaeon]|nr:ABC transporter ATP-binding protein [Methanomicrobiales archaeon]
MTSLIEVKNVWVQLGGQTVLEDVTLSVGDRDFYGIIGPNGGGKTTLLKVILGIVPLMKGEVTIAGQPPESGRSFLGYVPQFRTFDFGYPITVREMVLTGRLSHIPHPFRKFSATDKEKVDTALREMGIEDLADRPIGELSGGQQQRVIIARALVTDPRALLLDEPTSHVDPGMETEFYEILSRLQRDMAIVLVTHDLTAISTYVDKIACLNRKLFTHGTKEITGDMLAAVYQCPVDLIAHGLPHRVLRDHTGGEGP